MIELVFSNDDFAALQADLTGGETERCAILFTKQVVRSDGLLRLLIREFEIPPSSTYARQGPLEAELKPAFVATVTKRARREESGLVFAHSHPGTGIPSFSSIDDTGERHLAEFLTKRHPALCHAALLLNAEGVRARRLGESEGIRVLSIGENRKILFEPRQVASTRQELFDRQVRAFGAEGQAAIERLRVAVVGLGGTGSLLAQQLVHLGVHNLIFVDPDNIELTNLNRVANATVEDVGTPKVFVAERYVKGVANDVSVTTIVGDVILSSVARKLIDADLIFGCTDSHGSRAVLQQIAYQYMIAYIDTGVTIVTKAGNVTHVIGRAQLLAPGLACFACDGLLNPEEVRRDMMTTFERQVDPYIQGEHVPAPAVMPFNSTVVSLATTMMLAMTTGIPIKARHLLYNALTSTLRTIKTQPNVNCYICSRNGARARGNSWPLFARDD